MVKNILILALYPQIIALLVVIGILLYRKIRYGVAWFSRDQIAALKLMVPVCETYLNNKKLPSPGLCTAYREHYGFWPGRDMELARPTRNFLIRFYCKELDCCSWWWNPYDLDIKNGRVDYCKWIIKNFK